MLTSLVLAWGAAVSRSSEAWSPHTQHLPLPLSLFWVSLLAYRFGSYTS